MPVFKLENDEFWMFVYRIFYLKLT